MSDQNVPRRSFLKLAALGAAGAALAELGTASGILARPRLAAMDPTAERRDRKSSPRDSRLSAAG
ncbi:MAG TPA: hypothetical protein VHE82_12510 [Gemmatimonadaceae bacterium]|nr:hypothetical protein [Gemmatimonadaceae bacterium]